MKYCVVVDEVDYLAYQVSLYQINNQEKDVEHRMVEELKGINQDVASDYLYQLINQYKLSDYTQIINRIYKDYKESKKLVNTLYENVASFKKLYE